MNRLLNGGLIDLMSFTDEFPCTCCKRDNKDLCPFDDERKWDWSTDVVCPGLIQSGEE